MREIERLPGEDEAWRIDGVELVFSYAQESTAERFCIRKHQGIIDLYAELCPRFRGGRIVELGIAAGGSTALMALLAEPAKLVACELAATRVDALDELIRRRRLDDVVRPYYGVNQADKARVAGIVDAELGGQPIDLVVDDASHQWDNTCASFEVLFPRLCPGGTFVIEDWPAQYLIAERLTHLDHDPTAPGYAETKAKVDDAIREGAPKRPPLARLAAELVLSAAASHDVIAEVAVNRYWVTVTRGPAAIDADSFRVSDLYTDHFRWFQSDAAAPDQWWLRRLWQRSATSTTD
jgi:predicted O-methyltransferase YrrM